MNIFNLMLLTSENSGSTDFWGSFFSFLQNPAIIITLATLVFTVFAKSIVGIFKMGINFSERDISEKQLKFEKQIITDLRSYKEELLRVTLTAAMEAINDKLKDVNAIKEAASNMKAIETKVEIQVKTALEKMDEVKAMSDNLRALNAKVERLQYGDQSQVGVRRKE
jgi:fumarate reductase subunit C